MNIIENLTYQKVHFPNIYKNYFIRNSDYKEGEFTKNLYEYQNKIIIISDDYISLLKLLIPGIPLEHYSFNDLIEISLIKDNIIRINEDKLNKTIEIRTLLPYRLNETKIIITKKLQRQHLVNVRDILVCKDLSKLEQLMIVRNEFLVDKKYNPEDIKNYLINYSPNFNVVWKVKIEDVFKVVNKEELILKLSFYHDIIPDLLNKVSKDEAKDYIIYAMIQRFKQEALEVLKSFIEEDFYYNYELVQCYLGIETDFLKQTQILKESYIDKELDQFFKLENEIEKYLFLLESKMKNLNLNITEYLQELVDKLNHI